MKKLTLTRLFSLAALFVLPGLASAHVVPGVPHSVHSGFLHPLTGMDHLLAMVAVGLWAAQHKGRAVWMIPLTFVSVMVLGGMLGVMGATIPGADLFIAVSLLVLGGLVATSAKFNLNWSMALVGFFAVFHGYAHGHEMPAAASAVGFSAGFVVATLLLHGAGIGMGYALQNQRRVLACAGSAIAVCSVFFFLQ